MPNAARDHLRLIQHLFNDAAARHPRDVEPVLVPLYDDFVRYAAPGAADRVLDVGTGTGPVARRVAPRVRSVIGVDVAHKTLIVARAQKGLTPLAPLSIRGVSVRSRDLKLWRGGNHAAQPASPSPRVRREAAKDCSGSEARTPDSPRRIPNDYTPGAGPYTPAESSGGGASFTCADLHRLPFPAQTFTLVTASFGLNAADPHCALRELRRVIAPRGRIVIQEWGPITDLDQAVRGVLADFRVTSPPPDLTALRAWIARDVAGQQWTDVLQDADDYADWLRDLDFEITDTREYAPVTIPVSVGAFIAYALAGTDRAEELRAMAAPTRAACEAALRKRLAAFADPAGMLRWQPVVIRAAGRAPD